MLMPMPTSPGTQLFVGGAHRCCNSGLVAVLRHYLTTTARIYYRCLCITLTSQHWVEEGVAQCTLQQPHNQHVHAPLKAPHAAGGPGPTRGSTRGLLADAAGGWCPCAIGGSADVGGCDGCIRTMVSSSRSRSSTCSAFSQDLCCGCVTTADSRAKEAMSMLATNR